MLLTVEQNYRKFQTDLTLIFSVATAVVIVIYSILLVLSQRWARQKLQFNLDHAQRSQEEVQQVPPKLIVQEEDWDAAPGSRALVRVNFREYELRLRVSLIVFDIFIWLATSVIGYFLIGKLLSKAKKQALAEEEFLANASHELKTPITTIKTELSLLEDERKLENIRTSLKIVTRESLSLQNLISKLLLNNVRRGNNLTPVKVTELLEESLLTYQKNFAEKKLQFKLSGLKTATVTTDMVKLKEIMDLLLDNAGKYSDVGSTVKVELSREEKMLVIRVINQGVGIGKDKRGEIFKRFYRVPDKKVSREMGSGLGLAIAERLVRELDGELELESGTPKRTCFKLVLSSQG